MISYALLCSQVPGSVLRCHWPRGGRALRVRPQQGQVLRPRGAPSACCTAWGANCAHLECPGIVLIPLSPQEYFYCIHDPTTPNRQGNDVGTQYRSSIFYHDDEQKRVAEVRQAPVLSKRMSPSAPARSGAGRRVGLTLRDARRAAGGDSEAAEGALWREEDRHRDHPRAEVVGCGGLSPGVRARGPPGSLTQPVHVFIGRAVSSAERVVPCWCDSWQRVCHVCTRHAASC